MSLGGGERVTRSSTAQAPQELLGGLIDWAVLGQLGYDHGAGVFAPDAGDPIFGFTVCKAVSCDQVAKTSLGLCWRCDQLWQKAEPGTDFERFCERVPERLRHRRTAALCRVCCTPGHERPVRAHGLCAACENTMAKRGQSPEEYVAGDQEFPPAAPRPSFGRCQVATCTRFAWRARRLFASSTTARGALPAGRTAPRFAPGAPASGPSTVTPGWWSSIGWQRGHGSRCSTAFSALPRSAGGRGWPTSRQR